jgi:hypothetical protein
MRRRDFITGIVGSATAIDVDVLSRGSWMAGYALVVERFQARRVFLAGDAAHLFTPTGGLGYNTAVEDAVNLGWKLAAVVREQARPSLLDTYELERQPIARRNTRFARAFADSIGLYEPGPEIEDDTVEGESARRAAGAYLGAHAKAEFNIPGVTFGARYDQSPIIIGDGTIPPPDAANTYIPSACPGGRAPHLWLSPDHSLFDLFGFEWTLLRLSAKSKGAALIEAAAKAGIDLKVRDVSSEEAREIYGADLVLIRPDQVVAWRSSGTENLEMVLPRALGSEVLSGS